MDSRNATRFVEDMGLLWTRLAGNRTMGRLLAYLMICDPEEQSAPDLAKALKVSKANISTTVRGLEAAQLIERASVPGQRRVFYRLPRGGWDAIARQRMNEMDGFMRVVAVGQAALEGETEARKTRVENFAEWLTWWRDRYAELLRERERRT